MPSTSKKQRNFMAAVAHSPAFAKKVGVSQSVGREFNKADKGRKFGSGGMATCKTDKNVVKKAIKMHDKQEHKGSKGTDLSKLKKGGVAKTVTKEMEYDYKTGKKSFAGSTAKRDAHAEKEGKKVAKDLAYDKSKRFAKGGMTASGMGAVKTAAPSINGVATKGKTKGTMVTMKRGGKCI